MGFELLPGLFWNSKSSHRGFSFGFEELSQKVVFEFEQTSMCGVFFRIERGECLGFWVFDFSSVDELESFVVFEKILEIRSSGPKILP